MRELVNDDLSTGRLPDGWIDPIRHWSFEPRGLRCGAAEPRMVVPGGRWEQLRVEIEVEPGEAAAVSCGDGTLTTVVDLIRGTHRVSYCGGRLLHRNDQLIPRKATGSAYVVAFVLDRGGVRALVDDVEVIAAPDPYPRPTPRLLTLGFYENCLVRAVRIFGGGPVETKPAAAQGDFHLEVNVNFTDDLMPCAWTAEMLDQLFVEFRRWGVKRCHWIHYGNRSDGWWDHSGWGAEHAEAMMNNVGEIFAAAVRAAHAHEIEIYGLIKPFEMGFYYSERESLPDAAQRGKLPRIGGPKRWVANFPVERRDLMMKRKPGAYGPAVNETFTRIDLVKDDAEPAAFTVDDLQLYVSDDNVTYEPYAAAITRQEVVEEHPVWEHTASGGRATQRKRLARVMRLEGLDLRHKYFAIAVDGRGGSFANTFVDLVHVYGPRGEERLLTYGLLPRTLYQPGRDLSTWPPPKSDFRVAGVEFDTAPTSMPPSIQPGFDYVASRHTFDAGNGLIAFARGKDPDPIALLSPAFPETRAWWLSWVRQCLDAGAGGIELRVCCHTYNLAFAEFGFEPPIVEEFQRRYGVDLLATDDFDRAAWRRLRGEGFTQFICEASALTRSCGKPLGLHVSPTLDMPPEVGAAMEIHRDWRTWLDEGLADSVTMKEVWPGSRLADEVVVHAAPHGTSLIFCPYALMLWRTPGGEQVCADWIRLAREQGFDGYQFYECAGVVKAHPDGRVVLEQPSLREVFQREFRNAGTTAEGIASAP